MINNIGLKRKKEKAAKIVAELKKLFPKTSIALHYSNNLELLIAVILSAQCTDKQVNKVTENLFKKYSKLDNYVNVDQNEFERDIKSIGLYRNKAKNILTTAKIIKSKYEGKVPGTMEELITLPGVARKTANIVLYLSNGKTEGIAVDTHIKRLSKLLGLTLSYNPAKIEKDLMEILPKKEWMDFSFRLIDYGRAYCTARSHDHASCPLTKIV